jgi:hypothetical protein
MPHITLGGRDFPLRPTPPKSGGMLAIAAAERSGDDVKAMALYYKLVTSIIDGDVNLDEVDDALADMEIEEVSAALQEAAKTYTQDPTSPVQNTSGRSSDGSQTGTPTSRVVSFSQASKAG